MDEGCSAIVGDGGCVIFASDDSLVVIESPSSVDIVAVGSNPSPSSSLSSRLELGYDVGSVGLDPVPVLEGTCVDVT